ncbi:MAG: hypothetical protein ACREMT_11890, partial [Vulcanimicrobiaceae bacterium]
MASRTAALAPYLYAAGIAPLLVVSAAGATLGFFGFYGFVSRGHATPFLAELVFLLAVPLGIV